MTLDEVRQEFHDLSQEDQQLFIRSETHRRLSMIERSIVTIEKNINLIADRTDPRNGKSITRLPQSVLQGEELSNAALQIADVVVKAMNESVDRFIEEVKKFD